MANVILDLPFDEADGSVVAYDYSPLGNHAAIHDGRFIPGREGNCVYFPGSGYAEIIPPILDLSATFTVLMWVISDANSSGSGQSYYLFKFSGEDQFLRLNLNTNLSVWTHIAVTHQGGVFTTYVNARKIESKPTPTGWGVPTGFCMLHENGYNDAGRCHIDSYKIIEEVAYVESDLRPIISNSTHIMKFSINGVDLASLGINVLGKPKGILDKLPKKQASSYNWPDQHGRHEDLDGTRYDIREIELECMFKTIGQDAMMENIISIKSLFERNGTQRLMIELASKALVYEVHVPDQIDFSDMKWRSGQAFCSFTLNMVELQPVKRVLRYIKVDESTPSLTMTLSSPDLLNIYWGDGGVTPNVFGINNTVSHYYDQPGTYYVIIAGVIEGVYGFTTNAVIVWPKFQ